MTIEQKAKAYDEAIKSAKSKIKNDKDHVLYEDDVIEIFPELAESEDERVRKGIIRCVKGNMPDNDFRKKYIAWLERQGAKVSAIEGFETEFERQVSGLIASAINKEHEYNQGYVKWTANALLNYAKHELEKRGEQKFADGTFINVDDVREDFVQEVYRVLDADSTNDRANQIIDAFDNLPTIELEKRGEQNRQMPSVRSVSTDFKDRLGTFMQYTSVDLEKEENQQLLDEAAKELLQLAYSDKANEIALLSAKTWEESMAILMAANNAYRRGQKEQKPAEWSEEDEEISEAIIKRIKGESEALSVSLSSATSWVGNIKDRVQLQSQWKPSKEQLHILESVIADYDNQGLSYTKDMLCDLYEQLKKL